jgi:hypothetical protein
MTGNRSEDSMRHLPFLFRFAQPLGEMPHQRLRYDAQRQISQVFVDGSWIDTPDERAGQSEGTRFTRVRAETTDDA